MKSFTIDYPSLDDKERTFFIYDLMKECLMQDDIWHFWNEEEQGIELRCDDVFADKVETFLNNKGIVYISKEYSKDNSKTVNAFFDEFMVFFHMSALLAMNMVDKVKFDIENSVENPYNWSSFSECMLDRIVHSFCNNMMFVNHNPYIDKAEHIYNEKEIWEGFILSELAIERAMWGGMRHHYKMMKNKKDKEQE